MNNTKVTEEAEIDADDRDGNKIAVRRHCHGQDNSNSKGRSVS